MPRMQPAVFERMSTADIDDQDMMDDMEMDIQEPADPQSFGQSIAVSRGAHNEYNQVPSRRFVVAVDFGTTFSTVAYIALEHDTNLELIGPGDIKCIDNYPHIPHSGFASVAATHENVPTEIWYASEPDTGSATWQSSLAFDTSDDDSDTRDTRGNGPNPKKRICTPKWGYGVHRNFQNPDTVGDKSKQLDKFKLMLDEKSPYTQNIRAELAKKFKVLKKEKVISSETDPISDYLGQLLAHAKWRLVKEQGLRSDSDVEFVLSVPVNWTERACRIMHDAMAKAVKQSGLGQVDCKCVPNLFLVTEPEAAAAYVLADPYQSIEFASYEAFILLDAGGGTVDASTYTVAQSDPLRLRAEAVVADGDLCGSSYLNTGFRDLLLDKLRDETICDGYTVEGIVDHQVIEWENIKRNINVYKNSAIDPIIIPGLKENPQKNFKKNRLFLTAEEIKGIFQPLLDRVENLLRKQLKLAREGNVNVTKVVLVGGFAASPSLQSHLRRALATERNVLKHSVKLELPRKIITSAVARGAVLRALRKEDGPRRSIRSSFGFLRTDQYVPYLPAYQHLKTPLPDRIDGHLWVKDTIHWLIKKGQELPPHAIFKISATHTFRKSESRLLCVEKLFVSDSKHESHYKVKHPQNAGAQKIASIQFDMTDLKTKGLLDLDLGEDGRYPHYKIEFDLVMIVDGRNLRFEARWPVGSEDVKESGLVSLAPAFLPGTA